MTAQPEAKRWDEGTATRVGWTIATSALCWSMTPWMIGLTILKESYRLPTYPANLYWFILNWYFPLVWLGIILWATACVLHLVLWRQRVVHRAIPVAAVGTLTLSWFMVAVFLLTNNVRNVLEGHPFHWPHP